jgi:hypothetical protein
MERREICCLYDNPERSHDLVIHWPDWSINPGQNV